MGDDVVYRLAGTVFKGRYRVLTQFSDASSEPFKQGATAVVYRAEVLEQQNGEPDTVALKIFALDPKLRTDPQKSAKLKTYFKEEPSKFTAAAHPHVVRLYDYGEELISEASAPVLYQVLEYMPGGTLEDLCNELRETKQRLDPAKVIEYLKQIVAAISHAHGLGIIHRDLKPRNILLNGSREIVKLADFGSASVTGSDGDTTHIGADNWAAPEHHPKKAPKPGHDILGPPSDVYTLGKLAYYMLSGEVPWQYRADQIKKLPAVLSDYEWSDALLPVLKRATRTEPSTRYQTAQQFLFDLTEAFNVRKDNHQPKHSPASGAKTLRRVNAFAIVFILVVGLLSVELLRKKSTTTETETGGNKQTLVGPLLVKGLVNLRLIATTNVNLRNRAGERGEVLCVVTKGDAVMLMGESHNNWYRVLTTSGVSTTYSCGSGKEGWVYAEYWDLQPSTQ